MKDETIIISVILCSFLVVAVIGIGAIGIGAAYERRGDCKDLGYLSVQNMPARCLNYWNK